jgi:hypothetical protein
MRESNWTPSIVPRGDDQDVYLVVDDLGRSAKRNGPSSGEAETVILGDAGGGPAQSGCGLSARRCQ